MGNQQVTNKNKEPDDKILTLIPSSKRLFAGTLKG